MHNKLAMKFSKIHSVAFATCSAFVDRVQSNSVGMKPLAINSSFCCTLSTFLLTPCNFLFSGVHCFFLCPSPKQTNTKRTFLRSFNTRKPLLDHTMKHIKLHI